jgi:hypothetical protein
MEANSAGLHGLPTEITVEVAEHQKGKGKCGELSSGNGCGRCAVTGRLDWEGSTLLRQNVESSDCGNV